MSLLIDGMPAGNVSAFDRGLLYGDGLFETMRFVAGRAPLWSRHMARLAHGCARLGLPPPDVDLLARECAALVCADALVRITLTRGAGERGYAPPRASTPTRIVAAFAPPALGSGAGIRVRFCATRLAAQPVLAGLKHLNRLEQVLARAEWDDPTIAEGLMLDFTDHVVSAISANLFAVVDGRLVTPPVEHCGVAGVARAEVLAVRDVDVRKLHRDELQHADEIFLSSSVRGIVPVVAVGAVAFAAGSAARGLREHWCALGFAETAA